MRGALGLLELPGRLSRRTLLSGALATAVGGLSARCRAHNDAGVVQPRAAPPDVRLTTEDGRACRLSELLAGRVTALQIIFTRCQATCPIQGAIFGQAARALGGQHPGATSARWLSLSIDPIHDDPAALRAWLARFGADPRWHAARPDPRDIDPFVDFLRARTSGADRHTSQVYFFNREGRLALRSVDFPPVAQIVSVLKNLIARDT